MSTSERIEVLRGARILTLGDVMLDEYVWGDVSRVSPEAPVPVVNVREKTHLPGGAGNTAAGVAALEATSLLTSVVGDDETGATLQAALAERGIDCEGVFVEPGRSTTVKTRVIAHNQQIVRADVDEKRELRPETERRLTEFAEAAIDRVDGIVISDYAKGVVSARLAQAAIEAARRQQKPIVVDPKGRNYSKYRNATVVTPNVPDVERAANLLVESDRDLLEAARRVSEVLGGSSVLITRGAAGMLLLAEGRTVEISADAHDVYDVTGAGDTVAAVLVVALARGLSLEPAVRLANTAAGIAVGHVGAARVTLEELQEKTAPAS